jgi:TRAP-type transport system small permease protein
MISLIHALDRACTWLAGLAARVAALGILAIVVLLVLSSMQRYVMGAPIPITEELAGLLFLASAFLSLAYGFTENRHVRLELLWRMLRSPWREVAELVGLLLAVVALVALIIVTIQLGTDSFRGGNLSEMTEILLWPWRMLMSFGLGLLLLAIIVRIAMQSLELVSDSDPVAPRDEGPGQ